MAIERNRACSVCLRDGEILLVKIKDPVSGQEFWIPPGGEIMPGESPIDCCLRETFEETGYQIKIIEGVHVELKYPFTWQGEEYITHNHFYLAEPTGAPPSTNFGDREAYIIESAWMPLSQARKELAFNEEVSRGVKEILAQVELRFC